MLVGSFQRSLDSKSRVTLPAGFRKQLGDVVYLIRRTDALHGYSEESYNAWIESLGLDPRSRNDAELLGLIASSTAMVELDKAGRLALGKVEESDPGAIAELELSGDVMVVGAFDHFEIRNVEVHAAKQQGRAERLEGLLFRD